MHPDGKSTIDSDLPPLEYPWKPVESASVSDGQGNLIPLSLVQGRRLGQARVCKPHERPRSLQQFLMEHGETDVNRRYLVIGVGSNQSASVVLNKIARRCPDASLVVPFIPMNIVNLGIGFMPRWSHRGYIGTAPYHSPGQSGNFVGALLDHDQLKAIDSTEPGYSCVRLSAEDYPLMIADANGVKVDTPQYFYVYASNEGILVDVDHSPLDMNISPSGNASSMSQTALFRELSGHPALRDTFGQNPGSVVDLLVRRHPLSHHPDAIDDPIDWFSQADAISSAPLLTRAENAQESGIGLSALPVSQRTTYGQTPTLRSDCGEHKISGLTVLPTRNDLERRGELCILIPHNALPILGSHCLITRLGDPDKFCALARVLRAAENDDLPSGSIEVDQMLRDSIGVALQELVVLIPTETPSRKWIDLVAAPKFVHARALAAEHRSAEMDVVLLDSLSMQILGIQSGDKVVLQGLPGKDGSKVAELRTRAIAIPEDVAEARRAMSEGGLDSVYGTASEGLGVYPDLAPVFIDSALRSKLNLARTMTTLRIRASRSAKILQELRELTLVLVLSVIGIITIIDSMLVIVLSIFAVAALSIFLSIAKVHAELGLITRRKR